LWLVFEHLCIPDASGACTAGYVLDDGKVVWAAEFAKDEERVRALGGASAEEWEPQGASA
jgi:hypothetical protein